MLALRSYISGVARASRASRTATTKARGTRSLVRAHVPKIAGKRFITTGSSGFRVEKDTFGDINVPADRYWGAQTQRYEDLFIGK